MKTNPLPTAPARFQRMILWVALSLAWAAEVVAGAMKRFRAGHRLQAQLEALVPRLAQAVAGILLIEALVLYGRAHFPNPRKLTSLAHKKRALLGFVVRRHLRGRTLAERIARLAYVLKHRASIVARVARRIARGLTQVRIAPPTAQDMLALPFGARALSAADTS